MWLPEILMKSYWQNTKTYYGVYNDDIVLNVFRSCYLNQWFCKFGYISVMMIMMMIMTNKTCEVFQLQCRSQCYGRQSPRPGRPDKSILVMVAPYGSWQLGPNCTRPDYLGQLGPGQLSPRGPTVHFLGAENSWAPGPNLPWPYLTEDCDMAEGLCKVSHSCRVWTCRWVWNPAKGQVLEKLFSAASNLCFLAPTTVLNAFLFN